MGLGRGSSYRRGQHGNVDVMARDAVAIIVRRTATSAVSCIVLCGHRHLEIARGWAASAVTGRGVAASGDGDCGGGSGGRAGRDGAGCRAIRRSRWGVCGCRWGWRRSGGHDSRGAGDRCGGVLGCGGRRSPRGGSGRCARRVKGRRGGRRRRDEYHATWRPSARAAI